MMPENQGARPALLDKAWPIPAALLISFLLLFLAHSASSEPPPEVPDDKVGMLICTNIILFHSLLLGIVFLSMNLLGFSSQTRSAELDMSDFSSRTAITGMLLGFVMLLFGIGVIRLTFEVLEYFNLHVEEVDPTIDAFSNMSISSKSLFALLVIGLVPVSEEIVFRVTIYRALRWVFPYSVAALVTALIFAAAHSNFAGFPFYVLLSLCLQEVYRRTGNLYLPITIHATFNLSMLTISMA